MIGPNRAGEVEENGEVSFFVFFVSPVLIHQEDECRCVNAGSRERERGFAVPSSCVASLCVCVCVCVKLLGERVLSIQVSWGNWCLILTPHLLWPLSHPYRSPSLGH